MADSKPNLKLVVICGAVLSGLVAILVLALLAQATRNPLQNCGLNLTADKSSYSVGDSILFTVVITPDRERSVKLNEQMEKNIVIAPLRHSLRQEPSQGRGAVRKFEMAPGLPLTIQVAGTVKPAKQTGWVLADFGGHGRVEAKIGESFEFGASAYPADLSAMDSGEGPYSNTLTVRFKEK
jgi:hypothetical protein